MLHSEYREHITKWSRIYKDNPEFLRAAEVYSKEFSVISEINLDPAIPVLKSLYCPVNYKHPRDPVCMMRSMLLMMIFKKSGHYRMGRPDPRVSGYCRDVRVRS